MQIDLLDFIFNFNDEFNVFSKSIIDDEDVIVRPCTHEEIFQLKNEMEIHFEVASKVLIIQNSLLNKLGYIGVRKIDKNSLVFENYCVETLDDLLVQTNTKVVDFFRKNTSSDHLYITNDFLIANNNYKTLRHTKKLNLAVSTWSMSDGLILTAGPSITPVEVAYVQDAARNGWNSSWNKYLTKFEKTFAKYVGSKYAIATSSCTGALQMSLMALGIGPNDEVLVPDLTWVASATAIRDTGAKPIFVDVELDSWNIDVEKLKQKISSKTKAIVVVHMYGGSARMTDIMNFAKDNNLYVVEDAAPAIGAKWNDKSCGTFGQFGCFSFQGAKLLVTGEGGMIVTDDEELYLKARKISDQGRNPNKIFWIDETGVKFKMSNIQAALGLAQIQRADENIAMKRRIFSWYEENLSNISTVKLNKEVPGSKSIYWMTSIRLLENCKISQKEFIELLKSKNIDSRPVFPAISQYPIWNESVQPEKTAKMIGASAINLPSGVGLSKAQVDYICDVITSIV
jgi:perosamine synthetase